MSSKDIARPADTITATMHPCSARILNDATRSQPQESTAANTGDIMATKIDTMTKREKIAELLSMLNTDDVLTVRNIVANCPLICLFALEATKGTKYHCDAEEMVRTIYPDWPDVTLN